MAHHNSTSAIRRQAKRRYDRQFASSSAATHVRPVPVPADVKRFDGVPTPCGFCGAGRVLCRHRAAVL